MIIHTVQSGENILSIAKKYDITPSKLLEINDIHYKNSLQRGQQLLILIPTKSYTSHVNDTIIGVCRRFDIKKNTLYCNNPALKGRSFLHAGTELTIKYDTPTNGNISINGYVNKGIFFEKFKTVLPYLTYVTFACDNCLNLNKMLKEANDQNKITLMKLQWDDLYKEYVMNESEFKNKLLSIKSAGFSGISISSCQNDFDKTKKEEFLLYVRKQMLGLEMLIFQESDITLNDNEDISDGIVALYNKPYCISQNNSVSNESFLLEEYSKRYDTGKSFIEIPSCGYRSGIPINSKDIENISIKSKAEYVNCIEDQISYLHLSESDDKIFFESLENLKAKLKYIYELGFMGIMLDVESVPISTVMLIYSMFAGINSQFSKIYCI